jgi:hypothetical protein
VVEFDGESQVDATITGGHTVDFNVMTRRGRCRHRLERRVVRGKEELTRRAGTTVLFLAEGESLTLSSNSERIAMVRFDALVLENDEPWTMDTQQATVFVVDIITLA